MAFETNGGLGPGRKRRRGQGEYRTYFVVIFLLIALPLALWQWTAGVFQPRGVSSNPGVVQRAMTEARIITTTIFST
jgi:hypothetical protein